MAKKRSSKKEKKTLRINVIIFAVMLILACVIILFPNEEEEKIQETSFYSGIDEIFELATVKCYYHNVAQLEDEPDGLFKYGLFQYGYKKYWLEYSGVIKAGIKADEVEVSEPNKNGVVCVYIPKAQILDVDTDETTMTKPLIDKGVFTSITIENKKEAYMDAQEKMKKNAKKDEDVLNYAYNNAKKLIEQYIVNTGKMTGHNYTVKWLDEPMNKKGK